MNDKKVLIIGVIALLFALSGGYYIMIASKTAPMPTPTPTQQEEVIPTLSQKDIGLTFVTRSDNKAVKFSLSNIKDIQSVDYEVTYTAKGNVPRGIIGTIEVTPQDEILESKYIDLGSCSSGKCRYDEGVSLVKLVLKITKTDGKVFQSESKLDI